MGFYEEIYSDYVFPEKFATAMSEMVSAFALLAQQCKEDYLEFDGPHFQHEQMKPRRVKEVGHGNYAITRSQSKVVPKKNDNMSAKPKETLTSSVPPRNDGTPITRRVLVKSRETTRIKVLKQRN